MKNGRERVEADSDFENYFLINYNKIEKVEQDIDRNIFVFFFFN